MSKWLVRVIGPDDVHEFDNEVDALKYANGINVTVARAISQKTAEEMKYYPICFAVVVVDGSDIDKLI